VELLVTLLIPLQIGARDMASGFLNMVSYWLFFLSSVIMVMSLFVEAGPASAGWTIYPPLSALPQQRRIWSWNDAMVVSMAIFIASSLLRIFKLCGNGYKLKNKRNAYDKSSSYNMGVFCNSYYWYCIFPCIIISSIIIIMDRSFGTSFFLSDIFIARRSIALPRRFSSII